MKLIKSLSVLLFVFSVFFIFAVKVNAQGGGGGQPNCFNADRNDGGVNINPDAPPSFFVGKIDNVVRLACNDAHRAFNGGPLNASKCYIVGISAIPIQIEAPKSGALCREALAAAPNITPPSPSPSPPGTSATGTAGTGRFECGSGTGNDCINDNPIVKDLKIIMNVLSGAVGITVLAVMIFAGIQYSSSGGDPQRVAQAKQRIINAVIALVAWFFLYAVLDWFLPGGLFK